MAGDKEWAAPESDAAAMILFYAHDPCLRIHHLPQYKFFRRVANVSDLLHPAPPVIGFKLFRDTASLFFFSLISCLNITFILELFFLYLLLLKKLICYNKTNIWLLF